MSQVDRRVVTLGLLAGVTGLGLALVWYRRRCTSLPFSCEQVEVERQVEVLQRLGSLVKCVSDLKQEVQALKEALPQLQGQVREELKSRRDSAHRSPRRKKVGGASERGTCQSSEEGESEGGYVTAHTDTEDEEDDEGSAQHRQEERALHLLLEKADGLHQGSDADKREGLIMLLNRKPEFGHKSQFLWRLTRAYSDCHDAASSLEEKKKYAEAGKLVGEEAVTADPVCADSHQWFAILCGLISEYETVQNKIKNGYLFKDHLDKAIELKPQDPFSYYLLGRWCYAVAQLSWIERKVATTLFGEPPSATVQDALAHFLKVEDIQPNYSKLNYVFLAKCYRDLGQKKLAIKMCDAAASMSTVSKEDEEAQKELQSLLYSLGV